ncbi:solute carrier organic anion transporter family member 1A5 isoform X1 [Sigmodon hispidus]
MAEPEKKVTTHGARYFSKIKMFLCALTVAYVSKSLSGSYMHSMLTQIERQFNIPTSIVGIISGSFEIGNLLLIISVSYFGTKLHRPIMIGVGCVVMGLGCFLMSLPHFLMGRYEYETTISPASNLSSNSFLCAENRTQTPSPTHDPAECAKEIKSLMWIYVMVGNLIRGIGETPIMPLGISYLEDFSKSENSPLYIEWTWRKAFLVDCFWYTKCDDCLGFPFSNYSQVKVKMFLCALTMAYGSKSLSGSYMHSMLTQIERQFDIPTSIVGVINGSFEIGNLLFIIFVSYIGAKLHRPIMIGVGGVVMGLGCFLISLPHFLMGRYEYETTISPASNLSSNSFLCLENRTQTLSPTPDPAECGKKIKSLMWIYVMVGNLIRGIGETPIMPLGISYIEDFAKSENSPLYIASAETAGNIFLFVQGIIKIGLSIGPLTGLLLASFCANIYVDTGSVNTDDLTITPTDLRWVGAWWVGFLICAGVNILTSIPFFFFPETLPKEGLEDNVDVTKSDKEEKCGEKAKEEKRGITKDFLPFLKSLFCNPIYMLFILISVIHINANVIFVTFLPKYLEQQYGISTAEAVFLIGVCILPSSFVGCLTGGLIMKKFKIAIKKAAYIAFCLSLTEYIVSLFYFMIICDNFSVAGLTTSYEGNQQPLLMENKVLADCNIRCSCINKTWDPVCGDNGVAYMSACLAGCEQSVGTGINMVFHNCSCIQSSGNSSAVLGLCRKGPDCAITLKYVSMLLVIGSFIYSLAAIPGYMVLLRCIKSEEQSLGIGLHTFCTRVFAGIPASIYFGSLIDQTCLYWGTLKCGEPGACRMYDINKFRRIYNGVPVALRGSSYLPAFFILMLVRKLQVPEEIDSSGTEVAEMKLTEKESNYEGYYRNSSLIIKHPKVDFTCYKNIS